MGFEKIAKNATIIVIMNVFFLPVSWFLFRRYIPFCFFSLTVLLWANCSRQNVCPRVPLKEIMNDILSQSPDSRLDVFVTDEWLFVNGAPVAKIHKGRFTDASNRDVYPPLSDALYQEFSRRGSSPYTEIVVYVHDRLPSALVELVRATATETHLAPVVMVPISFFRRTCEQNAISPHTTPPVATEMQGLLVRQEKDRILVNGIVVIQLENGTMPTSELDENGILCPKLVQAITAALQSAKGAPVLHLTMDADPEVTKYILVSAGKAGIVRFKTLRVIE